MDLGKEIYAGGFHRLVRKFEKRRRSFTNADAVLPSEDVDLVALSQQIIETSDAPPPEPIFWCAESKMDRLKLELAGESELHLLHAILISILRRKNPPDRAVLLFQRIWNEIGEDFVQQLSVRWMISAATTFSEHGQTGNQRACGMGLSVLYDLIKLHDSERRLSGQQNNRPFRQKFGVEVPDLAFDLQPYAIRTGDLDRNLLARLWSLCESDRTIAPLGFHMLRMVMHDRRTIFARMQRLKTLKRRKDQLLSSENNSD